MDRIADLTVILGPDLAMEVITHRHSPLRTGVDHEQGYALSRYAGPTNRWT
jgi:hypothetical protein